MTRYRLALAHCKLKWHCGSHDKKAYLIFLRLCWLAACILLILSFVWTCWTCSPISSVSCRPAVYIALVRWAYSTDRSTCPQTAESVILRAITCTVFVGLCFMYAEIFLGSASAVSQSLPSVAHRKMFIYLFIHYTVHTAVLIQKQIFHRICYASSRRYCHTLPSSRSKFRYKK